MKAKQITDTQLSEKLGCNPSTVFQWKNGTYFPRVEYLIPLCQILDCSADDLLGIVIDKAPKLPPAMTKELYKTVTKKGEYNSQMLHQMASRIRRANGQITNFELWLRELAEVVYKIELSLKTKPAAIVETNQLKLF